MTNVLITLAIAEAAVFIAIGLVVVLDYRAWTKKHRR